jgi:hypothetical protein
LHWYKGATNIFAICHTLKRVAYIFRRVAYIFRTAIYAKIGKEISQEIQVVSEDNTKEKKKGFNPVKGVIKGVGNVAGFVGATANNTAGNALQNIGNTFAAKASGGQLGEQTPETLAKELENYLTKKNKGQLNLSKIGENQYALKLKESGLLSSSYLFIFAPCLDDVLTNRLFSPEFQSQKPNGIAVLAIEWLQTRTYLDEKLSVFVWQDAVRLGADGVAKDYLSNWLIDFTGYQFEKKDLIEGDDNDQIRSRRAAFDTYFTGREEYADLIGRSITGNRERDKSLAWIFSISGQGGVGKSYLLQQIRQRYSRRMVYIFVDHQASGDTEDSLVGLMSELAARARADGCPTPHFDKKITDFRRSLRKQEGEEEGVDKDKVKEVFNTVSDNISKIDYGKIAKSTQNQTFKRLLNFADNAAGALNIVGGVSGVAVDVGFGIFDRVSKEQQSNNEAILGDRLIRELTAALIEDFTEFHEKQSKHYLMRRLVIVFDTYELIGSLADNWLRTLFLKNQKLQETNPVVITAGRYEIMRFNTRWTEFQSQLRVIRLDVFSLEQTRAYLAKMNITDETRVNMIYELTSGLPLFINLVVNLSNQKQALAVLKDRILEEIEPEFQPAFLDMAVPGGFNSETVQKVFNEPETAARIFNRLLQATFVEPEGNRYEFLPEVRKVLLGFHRLASPQRVETLTALLGVN